ncbi:MAG: ARMT1-like domain-containing protein, partial [Atopobiaceae bacterium]|nr:ARMT1-like domain-containing protein [Atopobiaceae bacterium]
ESVRHAKSVMYLGDNCGEIVLDKALIGEIRRENPDVDVTYGVRGGAVINDVTVDDAAQVGMADVARVMSSGAAVPATDLDRCSQEFLDAYYGADVVICKGMGNFESLCDDCRRDDVYFLLMTKCDLVAGVIGAPLLSLVCARNSDALHAI